MIRFPRASWARRLLLLASFVAGCGGNVVVDGESTSGSGTGATAGTGASTTTGTSGGGASGAGGSSTGPMSPTGAPANCQVDYQTMIGALHDAEGCTPTANVVQCTGKLLLHDPCGCLYVANDAHPPPGGGPGEPDPDWVQCMMDGCCGPQYSASCSPCPPVPTSGYCDAVTSQCKPGG
jgi:hypothetical protein